MSESFQNKTNMKLVTEIEITKARQRINEGRCIVAWTKVDELEVANMLAEGNGTMRSTAQREAQLKLAINVTDKVDKLSEKLAAMIFELDRRD